MIHFKILQNFKQIDMGKAPVAPRVNDIIVTDNGTYKVKQRAFDLRGENGSGFCVEVDVLAHTATSGETHG
ncbi:hypothetical protein [Maritalea sp.]|uniref:hypothetical protein n=1 Tax=Maritalea sp. TaxID=2003361 RepID=UPI003EF8C49F